jgi:hypothetical protein
MSDRKTYKGGCFCGAVQLVATGDPVGMGYCHCSSCRHWSAGPVNAYTLWSPENVQITKGTDNIGTYHKTPQSYRKWCKICGGHLFMEHPAPPPALICIYAPIIPDLPFSPSVHLNYGDTVHRMIDGLPKLRDFPKEFGGSGDLVPE